MLATYQDNSSSTDIAICNSVKEKWEIQISRMSTRWHKVCLLLNFVSLCFSHTEPESNIRNILFWKILYMKRHMPCYRHYRSRLFLCLCLCVPLLYRTEIYLRLCFKKVREKSIEWCYKASRVKWNKETQTWVMMGWEWVGRSFCNILLVLSIHFTLLRPDAACV